MSTKLHLTPHPIAPSGLVDPVALRDAMVDHGSGWGYRERRMALRRLAMPVIEKMWTTEEAIDLISASPLVGTGEKQVNVRKQVSGLRDQFDLLTLFTFAYLGTGLPFVGVFAGGTERELDRRLMKEFVQLALRSPGMFAMDSTDSKTGYVFGRHLVLADSIVKKMFDPLLDHCKDIPASHPVMTTAAAIIAAGGAESATTTTAKEKTTMETEVTTLLPEERKGPTGPAKGKLYLLPDTTLEELIGMIERVALGKRVDPSVASKILQANMASTGQAERFEGALEVLEMRGGILEGAAPRTIRREHTVIVLTILDLPEGELAGPSKASDIGIIDALDGLITAASEAATTPKTTTTATTGHMETKTMSELADAMMNVKSEVSSMIDAMLQSAKLPTLHKLMTEIGQRDERLGVQGATLERMLKEQAELQRKLAEAESRPAAVTGVAASHDGVIPSGTVKWVPAHKAFGLTKGKEAFGFQVPVWTWDGVHPHVPAADPHYVFRPFELMRVLYGIVANKRVYLHGHTGTGKTTLIEQVAARLGYAFMRLNFDSEISRMDLIGRDTLVSEGGTTVSRFVDGILPQMMQSPCIGCFDEIDFVRPDIAYVMQRMLEGDALVITEDGGRVVKPHPMFRAFATGNTVGQGDEHGMYQGARVQSTALLDRFSVWQKIDYLKPDDRLALIRNRVPALSDEMCEKLNGYITEHLQAFTTSKVLQPLSPRGFLALAEAMVFYMSTLPSKKDAVDQALESTILDRASVQDRVVLKGLASRVFG